MAVYFRVQDMTLYCNVSDMTIYRSIQGVARCEIYCSIQGAVFRK